MTSEDNADQTRRLDDELAVKALLAEAGFTDDPALRQVLLQLRELRVSDVPEPSAELAALLTASRTAAVIPVAHGKPRKRNHVVLATLAAAASFGVAGGAAAGNGDLRRGAEGGISAVVEWFSPPAPATPAPAVPSRAPAPDPAIVSVPAAGIPAPGLPREYFAAPVPGPAQAAGTAAATSRSTQQPAEETAEEVPGAARNGTGDLHGTRSGPGDNAGQTQRGGRAFGTGTGAAPVQAGHAGPPATDATEGKTAGPGNTEHPDVPAPPAPKATRGPVR